MRRKGWRVNERSKGILSLIAVCLIWGLSTIYYRALAHVPPAEVLAHRTVWSLLLFVAVLGGQRRLADLPRALLSPRLGRILLAAVMVSSNWGLFIWSVQNGHVVESSLGYYIYPLLSVFAGVVLFRERLRPAQWLAVATAAMAVSLLTWGLGAAPWISLGLALSFAFYGVVKKALPLDPILSVAAEVAVLAPLAAGWMVALHLGLTPAAPRAAHFGSDAGTTLLLIGSGPLTAVPLILFARAARSVDLATVGLLFYLNPTIQFLVAVLLFGEVFTRWHAIAFAMIWAAVALFTAAGRRAARAGRAPDAP